MWRSTFLPPSPQSALTPTSPNWRGRYKSEIRSDPVFRQQFQTMCAKIGVDPLASNKGFWSELLGMGDFYYELAVQVVTVCLATRAQNGGLMELAALRSRLERTRGKGAQAISEDDVRRAVDKLHVLGSGFDIVTLGSRRMVVSVPVELTLDETALLTLAAGTRCVSVRLLAERLQWAPDRSRRALDKLLAEGMAWVDLSSPAEPEYWFPSIAAASAASSS